MTPAELVLQVTDAMHLRQLIVHRLRAICCSKGHICCVLLLTLPPQTSLVEVEEQRPVCATCNADCPSHSLTVHAHVKGIEMLLLSGYPTLCCCLFVSGLL